VSTTPISRAVLWARFNVVRHLRKPGTLAWILGVAAVAAIIRVAGGSSSAIANLVVLYAVPLAALSFGTSAMREEIEDQTLTYVFTRSVDRAWIYVARVLAAMTVAAFVGIAGSLLATVLARLNEPEAAIANTNTIRRVISRFYARRRRSFRPRSLPAPTPSRCAGWTRR